MSEADSMLLKTEKNNFQIQTQPAEIHESILQQNGFRPINAFDRAPSAAPAQMQQDEQSDIETISVLDNDYAQELLQEVRQLADDRGKASDFFQPVVDRAQLLIRGNISEEKNASMLAELLFSAKHYLINRGSTFFPSQRNRRRASCQRLLDKAKVFYNDAPHIYSLYLEHTLCMAKNEDPDSREVKDISQEYGFIISEDSINARMAEEKLSTLPEEEKPKEVKRILELLEGVHSIMNDPMPVHPGKEASKEETDRFNEDIFNSTLAVTRVYDLLIENCDSYLSLKDNEPLIGSQVRSLKNSMQHTRKVFSNCVSTFLAGHLPDGSTTWAEAIAAKQAALYDISRDNTDILGDGTSVVYKINNGDDFKFFKKDEKTATDPIEAWQHVLDNVTSMKGYKAEYAKQLKVFFEGMDEALSDYAEAKKKGNRKRMRNLEGILYQRFVIGGFGRGSKDYLRNYRLNRRAVAEEPLIRKFTEVDIETPFGEFLNNVIGDFLKTFNTYYYGAAAGINPGVVMADRNVATSRMASLMGIGHLVIRSETADVMQNKKLVSGVLMDEAKGQEARDIYTQKDEEIRYKDQAVTDLMTMHVFDLICGQIDRNYSNFFVTMEGKTISGIQMIDNDMSFGLTTCEDFIKTKYYNLPIADFDVLIALPSSIKLKIHELATAPEEYYKLVFGDLLSKKEITFLMNRVKYTDEKIREKQTALKTSKNADDNALEEKLSDPEFAALYYQKMLWKKAADEAREKDPDFDELDQEDQHSQLRQYILSHSYLSTENILSPEEIEERLKKKE
ncbi:MAG: hypothetical protein IJU93_10480 [Lachnospiraceae bacterium]|nr:hypothetical protein [Lachnospiraceae bacterium]